MLTDIDDGEERPRPIGLYHLCALAEVAGGAILSDGSEAPPTPLPEWLRQAAEELCNMGYAEQVNAPEGLYKLTPAGIARRTRERQKERNRR